MLTSLTIEEQLAAARQEVASLKEENRNLVRRGKVFGLNFEYRPDQYVLAAQSSIPVLKERREMKITPPPPEGSSSSGVIHTLIKGDNYPALIALLPKYADKVDVIYIDPPYNTGNDGFIYDDKHLSPDDLWRHSTWLSFMKPRLTLAKQFLSESGVIFVSIDDNEQAHLKLLMDEIFGQENFVNTIIWERAYAPVNLKKHLSPSHDFILVYSKDLARLPNMSLPRTLEANARYLNPDNDPRGPWKSDNFSVGPAVEANIYPVTSPNGRIAVPPTGYSWRYSRKKLDEAIADNRIWFGKNGGNAPSIKRFASEVKQGITPMTIWKHQDVGHSQDGTRALAAVLGGGAFTYPKPVRLIRQLLQLNSNPKAIVFDFFAGSGTTLQAVAELNAKDGGMRECIVITDAGKSLDKPDEPDIAEVVTYERIRRVLTGEDWADGKQHPNLKQGLRMFEVAEVPIRSEQVIEDWTEEGEPVYGGGEVRSELDVFEDMRALMPQDSPEQAAERGYRAWKKAIKS